MALNPGDFSLDLAITNLNETFGSLQKLVIVLSYIIGIALIARGIMMYKVFATQTMSSAQKGEFAGPLVHIIVGAFLIYFPSTFKTSMMTMFGKEEANVAQNLIGYTRISSTEKWKQISELLVKYFKLIGLIAFLRGWIMLSKMGHQGAQPGQIAKGITHIIGGILLVNIVDTINMLMELFGYKAN